MASLALTYRSLAKYTEAEKLETQAHKLKRRVPRAESPYIITTMANVQDTQEIQVLDAGSTVHGEENLHSTQVVLNPSVQADLPDTTMNPEKKGIYLIILVDHPSCFDCQAIFLLNLPREFQHLNPK